MSKPAHRKMQRRWMSRLIQDAAASGGVCECSSAGPQLLGDPLSTAAIAPYRAPSPMFTAQRLGEGSRRSAGASSGQRAVESCSITINVNDPGSTGGRRPPGAPAGIGPNLAETMNTR